MSLSFKYHLVKSVGKPLFLNFGTNYLALKFKTIVIMAKGKDCPICEKPMYAEDDGDEHPAGAYVTYLCLFCGHKEKVFEDK